MAEPILRPTYGLAGANGLCAVADAHSDLGTSFGFVAQTDGVAPDGPDGEVLFTALVLTLTRSCSGLLRIWPVIDDQVRDGTEGGVDLGCTIVLDPVLERRTETYEIGLSEPVLDARVPDAIRARIALRGTFFAVLLRSLELSSGDLLVDGLEVEHEIVQERRTAATPARSAP